MTARSWCRHVLSGAVVVGLAWGASGCGGMFRENAEKVEFPPSQPLATWTVDVCEDQDGSPTDLAETLAYYLEQTPTGMALYEFGASRGRSGLKLTNHWSDADGEHFFAKNKHGYEYVVNAGKPSVRRVFLRRRYETVEVGGGVVKPVGTPTLTCAMTPQ